MSGIHITQMDYQCRVCATTISAYISPVEREVEGEPALVVDAPSYHRVRTFDCDGCGCKRPHVIRPDQNPPQ